MRTTAFLILSMALCTTPFNVVIAAQLAGASDGLQMLKKIQGRWQSDCYRAVGANEGGYRQERLAFSFTHLKVVVSDYRDANCTNERVRHSAKYRFVLGGALQGTDSGKVYALDLHIDNEPAPLAALPYGNIIQYGNGELTLGLSTTAASGERLTGLDKAKPYRR